MSATLCSDAEAIDRIKKLALDGAKVEIVKPPDGPPDGFYIKHGDHLSDLIVPDPGYKKHVLYGTAELVRLVQDTPSEQTDDAAFFVSKEEIRFVFDINDRRDVAKIVLHETESFAALSLAAEQTLTQAAFVKFLRITLAGCFTDGALLKVVRGIQILQTQNRSGNVQHGEEAYSKEVTARVAKANEIPESVMLNVQVYREYRARQPVRCEVDINPSEGTFALIPLPEELENARQKTLELLACSVQIDNGPPVYIGEA